MTDEIVSITNLQKNFGKFQALSDVSFTIDRGEVVGFIGPNGAGKSTTINHIIGLLHAMKGSIEIDGITIDEDAQAYKNKIAYIPETPILYDELTLKEHIELTILAYNLDKDEAWKKANELLEIFRLQNKLDWFPANFSKGMKQKVMIVCAFITKAKLFIIDEPFLGLDPLATNDLLKLIDDVKKEGSAVLMSTHVLGTAQEYCDRFVMINHGELKASGTLEELRAQFNKQDASLSEIYLSLTKGEKANE